MKITAIAATPVTVPLVRPSAASMSCGATVTRTIVEIKTDTGLVGLGGLGETGRSDSAQTITRKFAPLLIGLDPRERMIARDRCLAKFVDYGTARHGLESLRLRGLKSRCGILPARRWTCLCTELSVGASASVRRFLLTPSPSIWLRATRRTMYPGLWPRWQRNKWKRWVQRCLNLKLRAIQSRATSRQ